MPEQKLSYEDRVEIAKVRLAKAAFKTTWEYALDKVTNTERSLHRAAIEAIDMQAEAIKEFNKHVIPDWSEENEPFANEVIDEYLMEHGYIEPKTEKDGI